MSDTRRPPPPRLDEGSVIRLPERPAVDENEGRPRTASAGDEIVRAGEFCRGVIFIIRGRVRFSLLGGNDVVCGTNAEVAVAQASAIFNNLWVASVTAVSDCTYRLLSTQELYELLRDKDGREDRYTAEKRKLHLRVRDLREEAATAMKAAADATTLLKQEREAWAEREAELVEQIAQLEGEIAWFRQTPESKSPPKSVKPPTRPIFAPAVRRTPEIPESVLAADDDQPTGREWLAPPRPSHGSPSTAPDADDADEDPRDAPRITMVVGPPPPPKKP